jgi:hypothetical protein
MPRSSHGKSPTLDAREKKVIFFRVNFPDASLNCATAQHLIAANAKIVARLRATLDAETHGDLLLPALSVLAPI